MVSKWVGDVFTEVPFTTMHCVFRHELTRIGYLREVATGQDLQTRNASTLLTLFSGTLRTFNGE